jgi:hypothetical protein
MCFVLAAAPPALGADPAKPAPAPAAPAPPAERIGPEAMQGLVWDGLTEEQKQMVVTILNENRCDCGCGMTLARCRRDDSKCTRSLGLGTQIIALAKEGKGRDEIIKTALAPPSSKFVEFALAAGDAPTIGPASATVTILYYLDYQ